MTSAMSDERSALRAEYRAVLLASHLTADLRERAALQAAATELRTALYGSGGQFDGAVIAAMVEGNERHTYDDGDSAPLHCTLCFLGPAAELSTDERDRIVNVTRQISKDYGPFEATVSSDAEFGDTPVRLVEAAALQSMHDDVVGDRVIGGLHTEYNDHPHFVPHVSGLDDRDTVRFDRVAAMLGGDVTTFDLTGQTPDADADVDLLKQGV